MIYSFCHLKCLLTLLHLCYITYYLPWHFHSIIVKVKMIIALIVYPYFYSFLKFSYSMCIETWNQNQVPDLCHVTWQVLTSLGLSYLKNEEVILYQWSPTWNLQKKYSKKHDGNTSLKVVHLNVVRNCLRSKLRYLSTWPFFDSVTL